MAKPDFNSLLGRLGRDYRQLSFCAGPRFCWSPGSDQVFYKIGASGDDANYSLLHETGHALLGHQRYKLDFELLAMEVAAWEKARQLATDYQIELDEDHIQDCLDSYRDWLYRRSICPSCTSKALQTDDRHLYRCYNCQTTWRVSSNRFCRTYRLTKPAASLIG